MKIVSINSKNILIQSPITISSPLKQDCRLNTIAFKGDCFESNNKVHDTFFNSIYSFNKIKEELFDDCIEPILSSRATLNNVQPSILLCSADKSILNNFTWGITLAANEQNINITELSESVGLPGFIKTVHDQLQKNKTYYNQTGKRSIVVIDGAEKFLGMNLSDAKILTNFDYDSSDIEILNSNKNSIIINEFKSILDICHYLPRENDLGSATTFIFKTENPHLIHPHLRDGKMKKAYIELPQNENLSQLLKEQLDNVKFNLLNKLNNSLSTQAISAEEFQCYINKLRALSLDDNPMATYLLNFFVASNQFNGGFSCEKLNKIVRNATIDAMEMRGNIPFVIVLANIVSKTKHDIAPEQVKKHLKIKNNISKELDEYEIKIQLIEDGMLKEEEKNELEKLIANEKETMKFLILKREYETITPDETIFLEKLTKRYSSP